MDNEIVIALIGSGILSAAISGAVTLISKAIDRKHQKQDKNDGMKTDIENIKTALHKAEIDNVRLQMMVLMADYPCDQSEIMKVAEHYFRDLGGNWYMTSMFYTWLTKNKIAKPEWFKEEK